MWREDVWLFARSRKHEFEKGFEFKTRQGYVIYPFLRRLKLGTTLQTSSVIFFFRLNWHLKREKSVFWKASFCKTRTDYACKTSCTSFTTGKNFCLNQYHKKEFLSFFSVKLFYKSKRKLFSCVCIAWYKHSRGWANSRQLCKPETKSRVCITVSNSPNPSSVYIRLCKRGNRFLLLKCKYWTF